MKKSIILSLILSLSVLSSSTVFSDIKAKNNPDLSTVQTQQKAQTQNIPSWLGVWIEDIPMSLAKHIAPLLKNNQGVIIRKVSPDSPAQAAGLQEYDVITQFNDQKIYSQKQLTALVRSTAPETTITLGIIHQGKPVTKEVILKASPKQSLAQQQSKSPGHSHAVPTPFHHRGLSAPQFRQPGSMGFLPPPSWLNDPFFQQGFNDPFPPLNGQVNPGLTPGNQSSSWSESHFESIEIESTGDDKIRAAVKYEDSNGNKKEFVFEGNQNEIRQQIMNQQDMEDQRKQRLLQALDMSNKPIPVPEIRLPDWFNQPFQPYFQRRW